MFAREEKRAIIKDRRGSTSNPRAMKLVSVIRLYRRKKSKPDSWVVYFFDHGSGYFKHLFKDEEVTRAWQTLDIHSGGWVKETRSVFWFRKIILPEMEEKVHFGEWVKIPILPIRKRKKKVNILDLSRVEHQHEALFREFIKTRNVWRELVSNMLGVFYESEDSYEIYPSRVLFVGRPSLFYKWRRKITSLIFGETFPPEPTLFLHNRILGKDPESIYYGWYGNDMWWGNSKPPLNRKGIFTRKDIRRLRELMDEIVRVEKVLCELKKRRQELLGCLKKKRLLGFT